MKIRDTDEVFANDLCDPTFAAGYVTLSLEEDGIDGLLYSLQKVSKAHGMSNVAETTGLNRETLYRSLSLKGNPTIKSLLQIASAVGLRLAIIPSSIESFEPQVSDNESVISDCHSEANIEFAAEETYKDTKHSNQASKKED